MIDWLHDMAPHWIWLSLGVLLMAVEIIAPGFFLIWLGIAAIVVGVLAWLLPIGVAIQLGLFALCSFLVLYGARRWLRDNPIASGDPLLNHRAARHVGKTLTLVTAIENGRGRAKVGDGEWLVQGQDSAKGSKVRVTDCQGTILIVESV